MARIGQGKHPFRIIFYFLCRRCHDAILVHAAYREGWLEENDRWVKKLPKSALTRSIKPISLQNILPLLCSDCKKFTLNASYNLHALYKPISIPRFKQLFLLLAEVLCLYGIRAEKSKSSGGTIAGRIKSEFFNEFVATPLDKPGADLFVKNADTIWPKLFSKYPELEALIDSKINGNLEEKHADWLFAKSCVFHETPKYLHEFLNEKGWGHVRELIKPYGFTYTKVSKNI